MSRRLQASSLLAMAASGLIMAARASASLLLYEPFDYAAGQGLAGTSGQTGAAGETPATGKPFGLTAPNGNTWMTTAYSGLTPYSPANDAQTSSTDLAYLNLAHPTTTGSVFLGGGGSTARLAFTPVGNDTVNGSSVSAYYSFVFRITDLAGVNAAGGLLAGFNNTRGAQSGNPSSIGAPVFAKPSGAGFVLGVLEQGNDASQATYDTNELALNQDYFVVGKYTINGTNNVGGATPTTDDAAQIWINPTSLGGVEPSGALVALANRTDIPTNNSDPDGSNRTLQSFLLRQTGTGGGTATNSAVGNVFIDELRIGTTFADVTPIAVPEADSLLLAGEAMSISIALLVGRYKARSMTAAA